MTKLGWERKNRRFEEKERWEKLRLKKRGIIEEKKIKIMKKKSLPAREMRRRGGKNGPEGGKNGPEGRKRRRKKREREKLSERKK